MKSIQIAVLACVLAVSVVTAQSPMRPGNWETTVQMEMPGMSMPAMKTAKCVTAAQLKDPVQSVPSTAPGCTMSNYRTEGSKVTWTMACKDMSGTGEMTFKGDDTYVGQINVTSPHAMVMKLTGKRIGDCTQ
jgi:hypothetical protein